MVKRNLAGGARQEGQVIFTLSCGGDGWVREYVYKSFRVALCSIIYILCRAVAVVAPWYLRRNSYMSCSIAV